MGGIRGQRAIPTKSGMVARDEVRTLVLQVSCSAGAEHAASEGVVRETRPERGVRSQHSEKGAVVVGNRQSGYEESARSLSAAAIPVTLLVVVLLLQHAPHTTEMSLASRMWLMSGDLPCQGDTQSAWPRNVTGVAGCGRPVVSDGDCAPRPFMFGAPSARVRQLFKAASTPFLGLQTSVGHDR